METRIEKDSLGAKEVPASAWYGIQTLRGMENFPITGWGPDPDFVTAYLYLKKSAALANQELGMLDATRCDAITAVIDELMEKKDYSDFVIDVFQAGAGTSHNMNVNEVLANRANVRLGGQRGTYDKVHPNDHVNMAQSTNDSFPTAMRVSCLLKQRALVKELELLTGAFNQKAAEFDTILTSARTHLQDAVPIRLGQEFHAFAWTLDRAKSRILSVSERLQDLNFGATAAGTGVNSHPEYAKLVARKLAKLTGLKLQQASSLIAIATTTTDIAEYSGALKNLALDLIKIANDLRLLSSGPNTGFAEILLPPVQPGSSIMPGKVNPVMAENLNMVCFQVVGNDLAVSLGSQASQLQLNVMMPGMIFAALFSMRLLTNTMDVFRRFCVEGITAYPGRCQHYFESSAGLATVLNPIIGYAKAAELVKEGLKTGKNAVQLIREKGLLSEDELKTFFDPKKLTEPGFLKK